MTKLEMALAQSCGNKDIDEEYILDKCPTDFGLRDSINCGEDARCSECWNEEVT